MCKCLEVVSFKLDQLGRVSDGVVVILSQSTVRWHITVVPGVYWC